MKQADMDKGDGGDEGIDVIPESLRAAASLVDHRPGDSDVLARFVAALALFPARDALTGWLPALAASPDAAAAVIEHLAATSPPPGPAPDLLLRLGYVRFSAGDDDGARDALARARGAAGGADTAETLKLEAVLTQDPAARRKLHNRILMMAPTDRTAWETVLASR